MMGKWSWLRPYTESLPHNQELAIFWREMQPVLDIRNQCHADRSKGQPCWCGAHRRG